jgi:hypothetical protein
MCINHPASRYSVQEMEKLTFFPVSVFSLDAQLGFFPGMEGCRNPLLNDIPEPRNENHHIIGKRKSKNKLRVRVPLESCQWTAYVYFVHLPV